MTPFRRRHISASLLALLALLVAAPVVLAAEAITGIDPATLTFGFFITPPGMLAAGAFTSVFVQMMKGYFPTLDAKVSGALQSLFFTSLLYIATGLVLASEGIVNGPNGILWVFIAWLTVASSAIGIKAGFTHAANAPAKGLPLTDAVPPPPDESATDPVVGEDQPDPRYPS